MALMVELGCDEGSGNALDTSGNGWNMTPISGAFWGGAGTGYHGGNCLRIDAGTAWSRWQFDAPQAEMEFMRTAYTVSCWCRRQTNQTWQSVFAFQNAASAPPGGDAAWRMGNFHYQPVQMNHNFDGYVIQITPSTNWEHWAWGYNLSGGALKVWQNGVVVLNITGFAAPPSFYPTMRFTLGNNTAWAQEGFDDGYIDQVRIYDELRTDQQVIDDMNTEIGGGSPDPTITFTQQPTSTAITSDSVTAQATVETDAP